MKSLPLVVTFFLVVLFHSLAGADEKNINIVTPEGWQFNPIIEESLIGLIGMADLEGFIVKKGIKESEYSPSLVVYQISPPDFTWNLKNFESWMSEKILNARTKRRDIGRILIGNNQMVYFIVFQSFDKNTSLTNAYYAIKKEKLVIFNHQTYSSNYEMESKTLVNVIKRLKIDFK